MAKKKRLNKRFVILLGSIFALALLIGAILWMYMRPVDPDKYAVQAAEQLKAKDYNRAIQSYLTAVGKSKDRKAEYYLALGNAMLERRKDDKSLVQSERDKLFMQSIKCFREAVRYDAPEGGGHSAVGIDAQRKLVELFELIARSNHDWESYVKEATALLQMDPKDTATRFKAIEARAATLETHPEQADEIQKEYTDLLKIDNTNEKYWMGLVFFHFRRQQEKEGVEVFKQAMAAMPDSAHLRTAYAEYLQTAEPKKPEEAFALLTETINKHPDDAETYRELAVYYQRQEKVDLAKESLQKGIAAQPTDYHSYVGLSNVYTFMKENDKAQATLEQGLESVRKLAEGTTRPEGEQLGRYQEGIAWLNYYLCDSLLDQMTANPDQKEKLMPGVDAGLKEMKAVVSESPLIESIEGRKLLALGEVINAEKSLRSAYDATGDRKTGQVLVAVYLRLNQPGEAKKLIQVLLAGVKDDTNATVSLARMCIEFQQYEEAQALVEDVLKKKPDNKDAQSLLVALHVMRGAESRVPTDVRDLDQTSQGLLVKRAEQLWRDGEQEQAIRLMLDVRERMPKNLPVIMSLLEWYQARGENDKVQAIMDQAQESLAGDPTAKERLNMALLARDPSKQLEVQLQLADKVTDPTQKAILRSDYLLAAGQTEKGLAELQSVLDKQPENVGAVNRMFNYAIDKGDWTMAQKYADVGAKANMDQAGGKMFQAVIKHAQRDYDGSIKLLVDVMQDRPRFSQGHSLLGDCYLQTDKLDKAREELLLAYEQDPRNILALEGLINLMSRSGQTAEYAKYLQQAYDLFPNNPSVRERYLMMLESQGETDKVVRQREQIYRTHPDDGANTARLAQLYERTNRMVEAGKLYERLIRMAPSDGMVMRMYADFLRKTGQDTQASSLLAKFADTSPNKVFAFLLWADYLEKAGQMDNAKGVYEKALQVDTDGAAYAAMAQFYEHQKDFRQAVKFQQEFIQRCKKPEFLPPAKLQLAQYFVGAQDYAQAEKSIAEMLKDNPGNADAITLRGMMYMNQKDYAKARETFDSAVSANPQSGNALVNRAEVNLALGDTGSAIGDLEAARKSQVRNPQQVGMRLAEVYEMAGDIASADTLLQTMTTDYPDFVPALAMRVRLLVEKERWQQVAPILAAARKAHPKDTIFCKLEAQMWLKQKQLDKALSSLRDARQVAPDLEKLDIDLIATQMLVESGRFDEALGVAKDLENNPIVGHRILALEGRALAGKGDAAGAEKAFTSALKVSSIQEIDFVVAHVEASYPPATASANLKKWESLGQDGWRIPMHVGRLMLQQNDTKGATESLVQAAAKAPDSKDKLSLLSVLAAAYQAQGQYDDAVKTFQAGLKIDSNDGVTLNNLAYTLAFYQKKYPEALVCVEKAARLMPNSPSVLDTYGMVLVNMDRAKEAEDQLNRGLRIRPIPSSRYYLGLALEKQDRKQEALEQFRLGFEMVKQDPKDPNYQNLSDSVKRLGGS